MDYSKTFEISASGMNLERLRLDVTALNIANANTTKKADGSLYSPMKVVAAPSQSFTEMLRGESTSIGLNSRDLKGVEGVKLVPSTVGPKKVHDPAHPQADAKGFVSYPNVNPADEMINMMSAQRSYEANIKAFNAVKTMALRALQIGGSK